MTLSLSDIQQLDAEILDAIGTPAQYTPPVPTGGPPGDPVDCVVHIYRGVQTLGEYQQVLAPQTHVSFLASQIDPQRGGVVAVDGETWRLDALVESDGSLSRWAVAPHREATP